MQALEQLAPLGEAERNRIDKVVQTLTALGVHGENVAEVAHDARNMVTALDLYCDLLQEPGVLAGPFTHYGRELRLVAAASRRLVEKLVCLEPEGRVEAASSDTLNRAVLTPKPEPRRWRNVPAQPIRNLAEELLDNRSLLASLAGPTIALTIDVQGGAVPVRMSAEDLTRILVNMVKNAAEAMAGVGRIHISLWESCGEPQDSPWVTLQVEDNGPGLPEALLGKVFEPRPSAAQLQDPLARHDWPVAHRGMGLSITRSIIEAAGGLVQAANREPVGACFQIQLPVLQF